eukprot:gene8861-biopygen1843
MLHFQRIPKLFGPGGWFPSVTRPLVASRKPRGTVANVEEASRKAREASGSLEEPRGTSKSRRRKGAAKIHVSSGLSRKPRGSLEEPREILEEASRKA